MKKSLWTITLIALFLSSSALAGITQFACGATLVSIWIAPTSASLKVGQSVEFTSTLTGATIPYSYTWFLNGIPVSGATSTSWNFTPPTRGAYSVYLRVYPSVNDSAHTIAQSEVAQVIVGGQSFIGVFGYSNVSSQGSGSGAQYDAFGSRFTLNVEANITSMSCFMNYQTIPYDQTRNYSYAFAIYGDNNGTLGSLIAQTVQGTMFYYDYLGPLWYTLDFPSVVHLAPAAYWLMGVHNASQFVDVCSDVQAGYESVSSVINGMTFPASLSSPISTNNYVFSIFASWAANLSASLSEENNDFSVASNSTVSPLAYNPNTSEASFNVSGASGTIGYTETFISKTMLPDAAAANVSLDGRQQNFTAISLGDFWVLYFVYPHSTHSVTISLQSNIVPEFSAPFLVISLAIVSVGILVYFKKRKR
jgi:hypothetical protein